MSNIAKGNKREFVIGGSDLRMLVHWASFGVRSACGGSYQDHIERVIQQQAKRTRFNLGGACVFGEFIPKRSKP